jgi:hypothetical protein
LGCQGANKFFLAIYRPFLIWYHSSMKLYHGTSERFLSQILSKGIRPRRTSSGNWKDYPSRPDMVYLTTAYPFYFGSTAVKDDERILVLEIDTRHLNENRLYPDEDFISQLMSREQGKRLQEVHGLVRDQLEKVKHFWKDSVERLGNCAHKGTVPVQSITRYVLFDHSKRLELSMMSVDPSISLLNYAICKNKYHNLVAWMFGDVDVIQDNIMEFATDELEKMNPAFKQRREYWEKASKNRTGVEVIRR